MCWEILPCRLLVIQPFAHSTHLIMYACIKTESAHFSRQTSTHFFILLLPLLLRQWTCLRWFPFPPFPLNEAIYMNKKYKTCHQPQQQFQSNPPSSFFPSPSNLQIINVLATKNCIWRWQQHRLFLPVNSLFPFSTSFFFTRLSCYTFNSFQSIQQKESKLK